MNYRRFLGAASAALVVVSAILVSVSSAGAQVKYQTLHRFEGTGVGETSPLPA